MMAARRTPGAGVRKPPREMLWGGGEDIASIGARCAQNQMTPRTTSAVTPVLDAFYCI